jgi:hypothetical protein
VSLDSVIESRGQDNSAFCLLTDSFTERQLSADDPSIRRPSVIARRLRVVAMLLPILLAAAGGCASQTVGNQKLLEFLAPGRTTRADAILQLGEPSRSYEDARILTYRVDKEDDAYTIVESMRAWNGVHYSLVLVFDDQGVLQKHALVPVRTP